MLDDIRALQFLYGANFSTHAGATVYKWTPDNGGMTIDEDGQGEDAQPAPTINKIGLTIWDGDGTDTYDFSVYETSLVIDLQPGHWSTTSRSQLLQSSNGQVVASGSIANAYLYNNDLRSLIENAIGGSGADSITGNQKKTNSSAAGAMIRWMGEQAMIRSTAKRILIPSSFVRNALTRVLERMEPRLRLRQPVMVSITSRTSNIFCSMTSASR
jgi:Peptidase M10 serralysin C terminal